MYRETRESSTEEYWYLLRLGSLDWRMYILDVGQLGGRMVMLSSWGKEDKLFVIKICQDKVPRL